jgi:hypothetical protein
MSFQTRHILRGDERAAPFLLLAKKKPPAITPAAKSGRKRPRRAGSSLTVMRISHRSTGPDKCGKDTSAMRTQKARRDNNAAGLSIPSSGEGVSREYLSFQVAGRQKVAPRGLCVTGIGRSKVDANRRVRDFAKLAQVICA